MRSSWLLLVSLLLTVFIAASCVAGLAAFDAQALPQAIQRQLARSPGMSVVVIGLVAGRSGRRCGPPSAASRSSWTAPSGRGRSP
jgi:hypothetical protein